jgi:hypothetical protein
MGAVTSGNEGMREHRAAIIAIMVLAMGMALVNVFLMPPFQNPDEVQHFLYAAGYAYGEERMEQVEGRVLQLMKDHRWFHYVGIGPGWENTRQISEISFVFHFQFNRKSARRTLFHYIYGKVLKFTGVTDVEAAFYLMRLLSALIYLIIILLSVRFFIFYAPGRWQYYGFGLLTIFQAATILNAVNYDVLTVLLGVVFFGLAKAYWDSGKKIYLLYQLLCAALAVQTKLVGILFLLFMFIQVLMRMEIRWNRKLAIQTGQVLLLFIIGLSWLNYLFPERFFSLYVHMSRLWGELMGASGVGGGVQLRLGFFDSIVDSFYFHTGWMGFKLGAGWYILIKLYLLAAIVGIVLWFVLKRTAKEAVLEAGEKEKKWCVYLLLVILMQLASVWLYYGDHLTSQGRYMLPVLLPIVLLIYTGLQHLDKVLKLKRNYIVLTFLLLQTLLIVFAVIRIISVFYLEIKSPHPGF